jgi:hypothetical protein
MKKAQPFILISLLLCCVLFTEGQKMKAPVANKQNNVAAQQEEIKSFFKDYEEDLRLHRRQAIADRYDTGGYYRIGNGDKSFVSFKDNQNRYLTSWVGPKSFHWKDLSIEVVSGDAAVVTGLFEWQDGSGINAVISYTGLLVKKGDQWKIRLEDESISPLGYTIEPLSGNPSEKGLYKYRLIAQPTASIAPHRHSKDMNITVVAGRKFILMGNLDTARVQIFETGSSFVIPAGVWHTEWWETLTTEAITVDAPMRTERASPCSPRENIQKNILYTAVKKEIAAQLIGEYQHPLRPDGVYKIYLENDTLKLSRNWDNYSSIIVPYSDYDLISMDGLYTSLFFTNIVNGKATSLITTAQCSVFKADRISKNGN